MLSRRDFIKLVGAFGFVFMPLNKLLHKNAFALQGVGNSDGELYEGFVLLPADAKAPSFITPAKIQVPREKDKSSIVYKKIDFVEDVSSHVKRPFYVFDDAERKTDFVGANIFSYFDEDVFGVSLGYRDLLSDIPSEEANISLWSQYEFPRPYPLWDEAPTDESHLGFFLEKVDYLPRPGIKMITPQGFNYCWIEQNVLYMLILENYPTNDEALSFVSSLRRV